MQLRVEDVGQPGQADRDVVGVLARAIARPSGSPACAASPTWTPVTASTSPPARASTCGAVARRRPTPDPSAQARCPMRTPPSARARRTRTAAPSGTIWKWPTSAANPCAPRMTRPRATMPPPIAGPEGDDERVERALGRAVHDLAPAPPRWRRCRRRRGAPSAALEVGPQRGASETGDVGRVLHGAVTVDQSPAAPTPTALAAREVRAQLLDERGDRRRRRRRQPSRRRLAPLPQHLPVGVDDGAAHVRAAEVEPERGGRASSRRLGRCDACQVDAADPRSGSAPPVAPLRARSATRALPVPAPPRRPRPSPPAAAPAPPSAGARPPPVRPPARAASTASRAGASLVGRVVVPEEVEVGLRRSSRRLPIARRSAAGVRELHLEAPVAATRAPRQPRAGAGCRASTIAAAVRCRPRRTARRCSAPARPRRGR